MWYQVAVDDTLLQGSPSTSFDQPMTSLMSDAPVHTYPTTSTTPSYMESSTTTNPSNSDTSAATAIVFPTEALISDLSSVDQGEVCENEGGFAPAFLYKAQLDILFDTQESVAAWTTLVGERCFGGDWILVWADGSRFSEKVTGYGVTAGLTAFGTDSNDQQRVCFALEGSEFVAHACNGSTATTSMNVVCLTPPIVFKSVNQTDDATYDSQDSVCRSEGGKLLPRLTQANLKDLVYYYGKLTAWTTMVGEVCQGTDWSLVWPDETRADNETLNLPWVSKTMTFPSALERGDSFPNGSRRLGRISGLEKGWCEPARGASFPNGSRWLALLNQSTGLEGSVVSRKSPGLTSFANASGNVSEELRVCFIIEDSQSLVAQPLTTYLSMERTTNGSFDSQDALCAAEGGQAATRFDIVNLQELEYYYGSVRAWTTMLYEVAPKLIGWSRKEVWHDGESVSVSKIDIPVNPSEKYEVEKTFCFVFRNTSMLVTQECFDNRTLMSALCVFV
ncbi:hypothetical protein C7M84_019762 [Penaeus vannamei]|uniref:C-type lectin domain-containing protein n=1 Tax=Penaeus vannamei TaxID=6689 RepID=A0A423SDX7_PENVA|nr:hypothetical protein C7M84_019762 [Penaeus vannamei]